MQALACSVHGIVAEMRQIHTDFQVLWRKRDGTATLSRGDATTLALTGFYWLSNSTHQRRFSFIMFRFALGNYFLQITKERMLLITSYRLTRKKCCKCKGTVRVIGLVTLQSLGELAQTSGSYFKDMHAVSICCFNSEWGSFSKSKPQSNLGIMQAWFPTGKLIHGFGFLCADSCLSVFW